MIPNPPPIFTPTPVQPSLFIGHGSPMNAVENNVWTERWRELGDSLSGIRTVLCISAHWYTNGTGVTAMSSPRTIHDFGGFPRQLYEIEYPAQGDPDLANTIAEALSPTEVVLDKNWGLDHGTWSVLVHLFPSAEVPVVQLSIDASQPPSFHFEMGRRLAHLREEGVLILGSGNVVHNLRESLAHGPGAPPHALAINFEQKVSDLIQETQWAKLVEYQSLGEDAAFAVPTPDHYLPLLYVIGASQAADSPHLPTMGFQFSSVSMLSLRLG